MIEVVPNSVQSTGGAGDSPARIDLGAVTLRGEIVDSKCYLGVMNPGNGKVHRDCAARCISGGIPPAFVVKDASGISKTLLLAGSDRRVIDFVAEPVEVSGRLSRSGDLLILEANPSSIRRIGRPTWSLLAGNDGFRAGVSSSSRWPSKDMPARKPSWPARRPALHGQSCFPAFREPSGISRGVSDVMLMYLLNERNQLG